jgi:hypothetical protein
MYRAFGCGRRPKCKPWGKTTNGRIMYWTLRSNWYALPQRVAPGKMASRSRFGFGAFVLPSRIRINARLGRYQNILPRRHFGAHEISSWLGKCSHFGDPLGDVGSQRFTSFHQPWFRFQVYSAKTFSRSTFFTGFYHTRPFVETNHINEHWSFRRLLQCRKFIHLPRFCGVYHQGHSDYCATFCLGDYCKAEGCWSPDHCYACTDQGHACAAEWPREGPYEEKDKVDEDEGPQQGALGHDGECTENEGESFNYEGCGDADGSPLCGTYRGRFSACGFCVPPPGLPEFLHQFARCDRRCDATNACRTDVLVEDTYGSDDAFHRLGQNEERGPCRRRWLQHEFDKGTHGHCLDHLHGVVLRRNGEPYGGGSRCLGCPEGHAGSGHHAASQETLSDGAIGIQGHLCSTMAYSSRAVLFPCEVRCGNARLRFFEGEGLRAERVGEGAPTLRRHEPPEASLRKELRNWAGHWNPGRRCRKKRTTRSSGAL